MTKVLAGCRVIEHGTFITGPMAGMLLADLGAEVIKIERPDGGDPFRGFESGLYSPQFQAYNRNKKSVAVDLAKPEERAFLRELIASADVYIQNFRPGVAEKLGLGADALMKEMPRLIYCAISGFGPDGPAAGRPAYDTVAQATSGFLSLFIDPARPQVVGPVIADPITGIYAAYGVLGALFERNLTGRGRLVEVSMIEAMMHFSVEQFHHLAAMGVSPDRIHRARFSQSYAMTCSDGKMLALHLSSPPKFWESLIAAIGAPEIGRDPRFATRMNRVHNYVELQDALQAVFAKKDRASWMSALEAADVPFAPIYTTEETLADAQVEHLKIAAETCHPSAGPVHTVRRAVVYDRDRDGIETAAPPLLDEHGAEIRAEIAARKPAA